MHAWSVLAWISVSVFFALSLWFSATAVAPDLAEIWGLSPAFEGLLSSAVPIGFVVGTFISAYYGLSDRLNVRIIFSWCAFSGALINLGLLVTESPYIALALRVLTGITLAGVYPTSVKLVAQWFPQKRGLAIGIVIGALTLGSAFPHLINALVAGVSWEVVILISSILAFLAAAMMWFMVKDPAAAAAGNEPFSFKRLALVFRNRPVMLANYGYFGHMWELYAMWTWLPLFLSTSFLAHNPDSSPLLGVFVGFVAIGVAGVIGSIAGGLFAEKYGRARATIVAMAGSGLCAVLIGFSFGQPIWLTTLLAVFWGVFVIADSAQFSAAVSEFAEASYVGTALTFQMCVGFLITIGSIQFIPFASQLIDWHFTFSLLAIGPLLGIIAMVRFRSFESMNVSSNEENKLDA
ncbi:MFS transporter [Salsuginibacillus kocurii]|uniref:MFS transporter n=1 Tax=Salsuginibacillus kocurii TaxID=427078 RepID=UPI000363FC1F|nr:MFS transporter [Salsuginibacillus kocurii]